MLLLKLFCRGAAMVRIAAIALLLASVGLPVSAAENCAERATVVAYLADQHQETPVAMGLATNGGMVEVMVSEAQDSWTLLITMPTGETCMMASGRGWESLPGLIASAAPSEAS